MRLTSPPAACSPRVQKFQAAAAADRKAVLAEAEKVAAGVSGAQGLLGDAAPLLEMPMHGERQAAFGPRCLAPPCLFTATFGHAGAIRKAMTASDAQPGACRWHQRARSCGAACRCIRRCLHSICHSPTNYLPQLPAADDKENAALYVRFMKKAIEKVRGCSWGCGWAVAGLGQGKE